MAPTIRYRTGGSDTLASGSGVASAVNGSSASGTGAGTTITLGGTFDLTGTSAGDAIWTAGNATTDRHLFEIVSFTGGVAACTAVVVVEAITATFSGANWAVGGNRLTLENDTNEDWNDYSAGWTCEVGDGLTLTVTAAIGHTGGDNTDGPITFTGQSGSASTGIISSGTATTFGIFEPTGGSMTVIKHLTLSNTGTSASNNMAWRPPTNDNTVYFYDCDIDVGGSSCVSNEGRSRGYIRMDNCRLQNSTNTTSNTRCLLIQGGYFGVDINGCEFIGQGAAQGTWSLIVATSSTGLGWFIMRNSILRDSGGDGFESDELDTNNVHILIENCIFENCTDGISLEGSPSLGLRQSTTIRNCIFTNNSGYGINGEPGQDVSGETLCSHNAFYNNTSGQVQNIKNDDAVTLTADPYEDAASDDYRLNSTAGGGAACKGVGYPSKAGLL